MASLLSISCHARIGWGPFGLRGTYFHCLMYLCFSHWSSLHPSAPMQNSQKHAYFLILIENISPTSLLHTECNSLVPYIVLQYQVMDLLTPPSSTFQKNLCTDLICALPSLPKWNLRQLTTSTNDLIRSSSWLIWYLLSVCFTQEHAPSCSPFPCSISKNLQVC